MNVSRSIFLTLFEFSFQTFSILICRISAEGNPELLNKFNNTSQPSATLSSMAYNNNAPPSQPPIKKLKIPTSALRQQQDDSDSGSSSSAAVNNKKKAAGTTSPTSNLGKTKSRTGAGNKKRTSNLTSEPVSPVAGGDEQSAQTTPKKAKVKQITNGDGVATFECTETNCRKRYKSHNGLQYHQRTAHAKKMDSFEEKVELICLLLYTLVLA